MARRFRFVGIALLPIAAAVPAHAGMKQDLADCTAADRPASAGACTRVMNSGRLPDEQFYIGHYNRGWSYLNSGEYDKALADFDKSISHLPSYADTYFSREIVQHERGEREKSLAELDSYLERKSGDWDAHVKRSAMFRWRGEPSNAFSEVQ
jgi:tetratricopeptide (TPR) repeat protein